MRSKYHVRYILTYHASMCSLTEASVTTSMKRCSCCYCGCCCLLFINIGSFSSYVYYSTYVTSIADQRESPYQQKEKVHLFFKITYYNCVYMYVCSHSCAAHIICVCTHQCHSTYLEDGGQLSVVGSLFHLNMDTRVESRISGLQACMTRALTHQTISLGPTF